MKTRIDNLRLEHATNGIVLEYSLITEHGTKGGTSWDDKKELFEFDGKNKETQKKAAIDRLSEMYKIHMKNPLPHKTMEKSIGGY